MFERSATHAELVAKADREALRVLYVGWTRARDRLILAAQQGQFFGGILGKLVAIEPSAIASHQRAVLFAGLASISRFTLRQ